MDKVRPRITKEEYRVILELREKHRALSKECESSGIPVEDVKHYWYKGQNFSIFTKPGQKNYQDVRDEVVSEMQKYAPEYPKLKLKPPTQDGHLLVIDPADVHFGKLATAYESGDAYTMDIAEQRVLEGVSGLLQKASGFVIDEILLVIGNDILHIDSPGRKTTGGTPQDTDGMWYEAFLKAKTTVIKVIESLMPIAPLTVQYDPSNHDYMSGFFFADTISSWFCNTSVKFNVSIAHRKYFQYGTSLIGTTHGDGAKMADLPLLMAQESGEAWSKTKHRYFYTHHLHHKTKNDHIGVTCESLRSPSGTDSWHHRNGYQHSPKAIEAFIHSKEHGQVCRLTHNF